MATVKPESIPGHYTAVVEISRVTDEHQAKNDRGYPEGGKVPRKVEEVARFVVRGNDLDLLKARVNEHISLVEDDA